MSLGETTLLSHLVVVFSVAINAICQHRVGWTLAKFKVYDYKVIPVCLKPIGKSEVFLVWVFQGKLCTPVTPE